MNKQKIITGVLLPVLITANLYSGIGIYMHHNSFKDVPVPKEMPYIPYSPTHKAFKEHKAEGEPDFTDEIALLFHLETDAPQQKEIPLEVKNKEVLSTPPPLKLIGIVETAEGKLFSLKNTANNRLLLLERGIEREGITLLEEEENAIVLTIKNSIFKVEKR